MTPKIQLLVGMIASGKSTYARQAAKEGAIIINDDDLVSMLHGGDYSLYDKGLKRLYKSAEMHLACTALAMGRTVVIDRGVNVRKSARTRWLSLAKSLDVPCEAVVFKNEGASIHAGRRTRFDGRGYDEGWWWTVASAHEEGWVEPCFAEGFDAIFKYDEGFLFENKLCRLLKTTSHEIGNAT